MKKLLLILLIVVVSLAGLQTATASGPPPHFNVDALNTEERDWLERFYKGTILCDGWNEISRKILVSMPQEYRAEKKEMLEELGLKIGLEWSRANDVRRIDTKMLRSWGSELKKASTKGPVVISQVLAGINSEVDTLLR
jgi:hypothetical protein